MGIAKGWHSFDHVMISETMETEDAVEEDPQKKKTISLTKQGK